MIVLILGATGFIGSAVAAAALERGHRVVATYHSSPAPAEPQEGIRWVKTDLSRMMLADWRVVLTEIDAVVNCIGVLQDNGWVSTRAVHVDGLKALITACEQRRVTRFIHFSSIGVDLHQSTPFSETKRDGETLVRAALLDWVILRPSVVVGQGAFGGSALFRGLAALPVLPVLPATAPLQIVQREDVVRAVLHFLDTGSEARTSFDLVGPERLSMAHVIAHYRRWLGWPPAKTVEAPRWIAGILYGLGDFVRMLGWRPPVGSTARREMRHGAIGDPTAWQQAVGVEAQSLENALARTPPCVQERWFARLYVLKPLAFAVYAMFWLSTGVVSLTSGYHAGTALMMGAGAGAFSRFAVVAGALADIGVGLAIAVRPATKWGLIAAIVITGFYLVTATLSVPQLWSDPLGPLVKVIPLLVFNFMLLAILEER